MSSNTAWITLRIPFNIMAGNYRAKDSNFTESIIEFLTKQDVVENRECFISLSDHKAYLDIVLYKDSDSNEVKEQISLSKINQIYKVGSSVLIGSGVDLEVGFPFIQTLYLDID